jgi:NADH:ubiquinone oxidoreductase subunit 5 (subunit L)/multisubunit Na+/H+ antiporter MnhA subunit
MGFARFAKVVILLSAAAVLVMSVDYMRRRDLMKFEYPILIVLAVVGMMMMVSSGNLMSLYMGLELQSLSLYVVASFRRDSVKSTEAGDEVFCPWRVVVWSAALRCIPGLRLYRAAQISPRSFRRLATVDQSA